MILRIPLLAGAFAGLCSAFYFLAVVVGAGPFVPIVPSIISGLALVWWFRLPPRDIPADRATGWLSIVFFAVLAAAVIAFAIMAGKQPHGFWDAWSIWNLHARFLERQEGSHWTAMFSAGLNWTHSDYPLLVPALIAQIWSLIRSETVLAPMAVAFFFTFGAAAILIGSLRILRGWDQALIAGTFLLASVEFLEQGVVQYADIPLAFYIVASLSLLFFDDSKCLVLAGVMAGFAASTKNEGLLFLVALVVARFIAQWRFGKISALRREVLFFGAGALPPLAILALFKFKYAPANETIFLHKLGDVLARLLDIGRYVTVAEAFVKQAFQTGSFLVPAILILALYAWLVRFDVSPRRRTGVATVIGAVLMMLAGDFAVYVLFSNDVNWQMSTSLDRLMMQLWPAALLGFFAASSQVQLRMPRPEHKEARHRDAKGDIRKETAKAGATRRR